MGTLSERTKRLATSVVTLAALTVGAGNAMAWVGTDPSNTMQYQLTLNGTEYTTPVTGDYWRSESSKSGLVCFDKCGMVNGSDSLTSNWMDPIWHWSNVQGIIDGATGNLTISGQMKLTHKDNGWNPESNPEMWSFTSVHTGFKTTDSDFSLSSFGNNEFVELLTGEDVSTEQRYDLDIGWTDSVMNIFMPNGDNWAGVDKIQEKLAGGIGADLKYDYSSGKLQWAAWWEATFGDPYWAIQLDSKVHASGCKIGTPGCGPGGTPTASEPASLGLVGLGMLAAFGASRRRKRS